MAMEPPLGFTLAGSASNSEMNIIGTAAKASFTSITSKSLMVMPVSAKSFCVTGTGPVSIIAGSDPIFVL